MLICPLSWSTLVIYHQALQNDGYVLICDGLQHNLKAYTRGGLLCSQFGTGYFNNPVHVAAIPDHHFVVVDNMDTSNQHYGGTKHIYTQSVLTALGHEI